MTHTDDKPQSTLTTQICQLHRTNDLIETILNALTEWTKTNDKLTDDDVKAILSHFGNWISKEQFTYWAMKEIMQRIHGDIR